MLFVSKNYGDGTYDLTDSITGIVDRCTLQELHNKVKEGVRITGVNPAKNSVNVYNTAEDYIKFEVARSKLLGDVEYFEKGYSYVTGGCKNLKTYSMPNFVTHVDYEGFRDCKMLKTVEFSSSLYEIKAGAFRGCESLQNFKLPNSLGSLSYSAFRECTSLTEVYLPASIRWIGWDVFNGCTSLKKVVFESEVKELGRFLFTGCTNLKVVELPAGFREAKIDALDVPETCEVRIGGVVYEIKDK